LALLGRVVVGVLAQVPLGTGIGNGLDDSGTVHGLEAVQFGLELLGPAPGDGESGHGIDSGISARARHGKKQTADRFRSAAWMEEIMP
ncbi:hypothetical protein RZS08_44335, partial [Arthrospira platensis SPKY1]|nr:hypothetical protein [Arthrospira platensis SPKY1]